MAAVEPGRAAGGAAHRVLIGGGPFRRLHRRAVPAEGPAARGADPDADPVAAPIPVPAQPAGPGAVVGAADPPRGDRGPRHHAAGGRAGREASSRWPCAGPVITGT